MANLVFEVSDGVVKSNWYSKLFVVTLALGRRTTASFPSVPGPWHGVTQSGFWPFTEEHQEQQKLRGSTNFITVTALFFVGFCSMWVAP